MEPSHALLRVRLTSSLRILLVVCFLSVGGLSYGQRCRRVDAAVRRASDSKTYFFSQAEYIVYSDYYEAEEDVHNMSDIAPGFPTHIDAAARWFGRGRSVYFKGCSVYLLKERTRQLRVRPTRRWGLPCDVDAAVKVGGAVYVFKGCLQWSITERSGSRANASQISQLGLPCDVDAALTWHNDTVYAIKDDVIWTAASGGGGQRRSTHIDAWSLCSWKICPGNTTSDGHFSGTLEADFACNGDRRFCRLRFDQTTLAGSHNAGSGFDHDGMMFLGCWVRNQVLTVLGQLRLGMRFLDVDSSWEHCGLLGAYHNFVCGGPICRMLKQIRQFLRENRHEVVGIVFNHEMANHERVLPALLRQLTSQVPEYLNSHRRETGQWPSLEQAIRSDKRLFVFVDARVEQTADYTRLTWIHSERLLSSTWRSYVTVDGDCNMVRTASRRECVRKAGVPLLKIAIFGSSTSCVTTVADLCLPLVHEVARDCGKKRHARGRAPNILLVDYPERGSTDAESVTKAAYFQNIRNLARLTPGACRVQLDAAVTWSDHETERVLFFSGSRVVVFNWQTKLQESATTVRSRLDVTEVDRVDAAFLSSDGRGTCLSRGCFLYCGHAGQHTPLRVNLTSLGLPCHLDATVSHGNGTLFFKGCQYWRKPSAGHVTGPLPIANFGVPCDVSAALRAPDNKTYFFKDDIYWTHDDEGQTVTRDVLDWSADFLHCD